MSVCADRQIGHFTATVPRPLPTVVHRLTRVHTARRETERSYTLVKAGFAAVRVSPRTVYVDSSRPDLVDAFIRKTFIAMIEGIREPGLSAGLINSKSFDAGIRDLYRTMEPDGVFCYTFFKGVREKQSDA